MAGKFKIQQDRHMIVTPIVRLSFPQLFTPTSYENDPEKPKNYRCDLLFTDEQLREPYEGKKTQTPSLLTAIRYAKQDFWGSNFKTVKMSHPTTKKGSTKIVKATGEPHEAYAGLWYIQPKTGEKYPPQIVGRDGKKLTEKEVYGGCWVRAQILVKAYHNGSNKGVALYLNQIMKVKDGEKFGGIPSVILDDEEELDLLTDDEPSDDEPSDEGDDW